MPNQQRLTRRRFIGASAVAVSAPFILPSRVWSAETKPNDKITLGFIGMGKQNRGLLNGFLRMKDTQTVAVCEVDTTRREHHKKLVDDFYAKETGGSYKGCDAYNDFRELLARKDINAVVIATPDHWHAPIAVAAARAGKDIYCEKPLCQSIHEARAMVNTVRENKRVFQTGSQQRSSKEFRVACELVRNGRIGKLQNVTVGIGGPGVWCDLPQGEAPAGLDWDMWLGPAPKRGWNEILSPVGVHDHFPRWRNYREYGGGMVTDWGAHHFDIAQWGMGMDDSGPVEIIHPGGTNPTQGVLLKYANGVEVKHISENGVTFFGAEGKIYVNRGKFEFWKGDNKVAETTKQLDDVAKEYLADATVRLYVSNDHKADWTSCIRSRQKPICDVEIGARSVTVCHLVNLSYYNRTNIKWDPSKNQFVDGKKEWLDVPRRGEWARL